MTDTVYIGTFSHQNKTFHLSQDCYHVSENARPKDREPLEMSGWDECGKCGDGETGHGNIPDHSINQALRAAGGSDD